MTSAPAATFYTGVTGTYTVTTTGYPVATITETLPPADSTYQAWQTKQLEGIEVEDLLRVAGDADHEHVVTSLGALH